MSADSGYAWWMARGGESNNVQGIGLTWLWRLTDRLVTGPAGPFLCIQALFWFGLAAIARTLARPLVRIAVMLVVAAAPVCIVLLSHVWSDVALMAALSAATGALLCFRAQGATLWLLLALLLLWWSLILRHNAVPAVVPLYVYAVYLWNLSQSGPSRLRNVAATGLGAVLWLTSVAADRSVDHRVNPFPALALWDLAAISLDRQPRTRARRRRFAPRLCDIYLPEPVHWHACRHRRSVSRCRRSGEWTDCSGLA